MASDLGKHQSRGLQQQQPLPRPRRVTQQAARPSDVLNVIHVKEHGQIAELGGNFEYHGHGRKAMHQYQSGLLGQRAAHGRQRSVVVDPTGYRVGAEIEHTAPKRSPCRAAGGLVDHGSQPKLKRRRPECAQLRFVLAQFLGAALLLGRDQEQAIDTIDDTRERLYLDARGAGRRRVSAWR